MRRWAAAFLTSLSITIGTFVLLFVSSEFSEGSIIGTVLAYAALRNNLLGASERRGRRRDAGSCNPDMPS